METLEDLKIEIQKLKEAKEKMFLNCENKEEVIKLWEMDKRVKIPIEAKGKFCPGCRLNYYNEQNCCWQKATAKLTKQRIYRDLNSTTPDEVITLNCYMQTSH